jgi:hypothetical protein
LSKKAFAVAHASTRRTKVLVELAPLFERRFRQRHEGAIMFTRCLIRVLLCTAVVPAISEEPVPAQDRVFLSKAEIESTLIGKAIVSNNLVTGMISRWEFHSDGHVDFVNLSGPGSASGRWNLKADGYMCVTMLMQTGCRYWFTKDGAIANANTKGPDAPTVAQIRFE